MKHPRLRNVYFDIYTKSQNISPRALGPRSIQTALVIAVKCVLTLQLEDTHSAHLATQQIQGAMHPALT